MSKLDSRESRNTSVNRVRSLGWGYIGTQGLVVQNWREDPSGSKVEREDRESKQEPGLLKFNSFNCTVGTWTLSYAPLGEGCCFLTGPGTGSSVLDNLAPHFTCKNLTKV